MTGPLDADLLCGPGLRVRFVRLADRIGHVVEVETPSGWAAVLDSVEGGAHDHWPASPPLQHLHFESRGDRRLALLLGMAGEGHWSLAVEIEPAASRAVFDCACRIRARQDTAGWIGSTYRAAEDLAFDGAAGAPQSIHPQGISGGQTLAPLGPGVGRFVLRAVEGTQLARPAGQQSLTGQPGLVVLFAGWPEATPATVRWRYEIGPAGR